MHIIPDPHDLTSAKTPMPYSAPHLKRGRTQLCSTAFPSRFLPIQVPQDGAGEGCAAPPKHAVNCPHGGELQLLQGGSWLWWMNHLAAWGPSWGGWHKPNPGDKLGRKGWAGYCEECGGERDHGEAMGKGNSILEILFPPLDAEPTPGMGEAEPNLPVSWGMEQVGSHPRLLALPLPADQPSHAPNVPHLLPSLEQPGPRVAQPEL